jgi:tRNA (Thr-GGU) A37 N-methylase
MAQSDEIRAGEVAIEAPPAGDAGLVFIGCIHTPWADRQSCPRQGRSDGPICRIEVFEPWVAALDGITAFEELEVL